MKKWLQSGEVFMLDHVPQTQDKLPVGVYELVMAPRGPMLLWISDKFELPKKIYGTEDILIARCIKTYETLSKNFGILFKGLKGTGKTITAKQICHYLDLPVILINEDFGNIGQFINSIPQDVILFFDEFEKTYEFYGGSQNEDGEQRGKKNISSLLTLMDGVFTTKYKRLFLMTTNKADLPDQLLSRPSRIRYIKEFKDLTLKHILEILNDTVKNKKLIPGLAKLISKLSIITIDIVKSVSEEANIFDTDHEEFFEIFNLKKQNLTFEVWGNVEGKPEKKLQEGWTIPFSNVYIGWSFNLVNSKGMYELYKVKDFDKEDMTIVATKPISVKLEYKTDKIAKKATAKKEEIWNIRFVPETKTHKNMADYAF